MNGAVGWRKTESDIKSTTEREGGGKKTIVCQTCTATACFHGNRDLKLH